MTRLVGEVVVVVYIGPPPPRVLNIAHLFLDLYFVPLPGIAFPLPEPVKLVFARRQFLNFTITARN